LFVNKSKIILLDEATSSIGLSDKEKIYELINKFKKDTAIVFITHKLNEIFEICDRVTVLRDGKKIKTSIIKELDEKDIVLQMFGKNYKYEVIETKKKILDKEEKILKVENLTRVNEYKDISFDLYKGEVIGLVGLKGAGKSELLKTLGGIFQPFSGEIFINDKKVCFKNPSEAIRSGIVYQPEDRIKDGLVNILTVRENLLLNALKKIKNKIGLISRKKEINLVDALITKFNIKTTTPEQELSSLSGGNKQKVLVAKCFAGNPEIFLLDEPTRGVDVECKKEILRMIKEDLVLNSSILFTSPEVEDLLGVCDRIIILFHGNLIKILKKPFNLLEISELMYGKT
jgi:ABC-type sugar transport system ATPase subunit